MREAVAIAAAVLLAGAALPGVALAGDAGARPSDEPVSPEPVSAPPPASESLAPVLLSADLDWRLHDRDDDPDTGYRIYRSRPADSDYDAYRLEAVIDAPPEVVAAAARADLADPASIPSGAEKTVLRDEGDTLVVYTYSELPVVADRDVTIRARESFDPERGTHRLVWRAAVDEGPAAKPGVVRMKHSTGSWTFSELAGSRTRAVYEHHNDLGGSIPAWVLNPLMTDAVMDGLVRLRARVEAGAVD